MKLIWLGAYSELKVIVHCITQYKLVIGVLGGKVSDASTMVYIFRNSFVIFWIFRRGAASEMFHTSIFRTSTANFWIFHICPRSLLERGRDQTPSQLRQVSTCVLVEIRTRRLPCWVSCWVSVRSFSHTSASILWK